MKVTIDKEAGTVTIVLPLNNPPVLSKSGKSLVLASTLGNQVSDALYDDKHVVVGVNAYVKR